MNEYEREFLAADGKNFRWGEERYKLCGEYAWAVPCEEALAVIERHGAVVEGGAGSGYWTKLLRERGVDVVAYDVAPYENRWVGGRWADVLVGSAEQMAQHRDRTLLLVWPPLESSMGLDHVVAHGGQTVVYVGEGRGGCTGDDAFHDYLDENFDLIEEVSIPRWGGIHDTMMVFRRKAS